MLNFWEPFHNSGPQGEPERNITTPWTNRVMMKRTNTTPNHSVVEILWVFARVPDAGYPLAGGAGWRENSLPVSASAFVAALLLRAFVRVSFASSAPFRGHTLPRGR
jgi:hypothetical protein